MDDENPYQTPAPDSPPAAPDGPRYRWLVLAFLHIIALSVLGQILSARVPADTPAAFLIHAATIILSLAGALYLLRRSIPKTPP